MAANAEDTTAVNPTDDFDLSKYTRNWPPEMGVDVEDGAIYGIVFFGIIGLFVLSCLIIDLNFWRQRIQRIRMKKNEQELESFIGLRAGPAVKSDTFMQETKSFAGSAIVSPLETTEKMPSPRGSGKTSPVSLNCVRPAKIQPSNVGDCQPPPYYKRRT